MSSLQFLLIAPIILAGVAFIIRRWRRAAAAFGTASILFIGIMLATASIAGGPGTASGSVWVLWGRTLALTEASRDTLLIFVASLGLLFLLTFIAPQSSIFVPIGLALISPVAVLLIIRPFFFGAVMILIVAAGVAILLQDEKAGTTLPSWRYLSISALAPPLLLTSAWMVETDRAQFLPEISLLIAFATLILLIGFPFHIWIGPGSGQSRALVAVIALGLVQMVLVVFCTQVISDNLVIFRNPSFTQILQYGGLLTLGLAAIFALISPTLERLTGYLVLFDAGVTLYALGSGNLAGLDIATYTVFMRLVSVFLVAIGLGGVRNVNVAPESQDPPSKSRPVDYREVVQRRPFEVILLFYGLLSLIGFPGTPGFLSRWSLMVHTLQLSSAALLIIMLSMLVCLGSVLRWLLQFIGQSQTNGSERTLIFSPSSIVAVLSLLLALLLAFFPRWIEGIAAAITVP